jgi:hypothetical protein
MLKKARASPAGMPSRLLYSGPSDSISAFGGKSDIARPQNASARMLGPLEDLEGIASRSPAGGFVNGIGLVVGPQGRNLTVGDGFTRLGGSTGRIPQLPAGGAGHSRAAILHRGPDNASPSTPLIRKHQAALIPYASFRSRRRRGRFSGRGCWRRRLRRNGRRRRQWSIRRSRRPSQGRS